MKYDNLLLIFWFYIPSGSAARLESFDISPSPLKLKENEKVTVKYDITVVKPLPDKYTVELSVEKKIGFWWSDMCKYIGGLW